MALAFVEPNLIAHSSLVTTDIGVTLFMFLTVYLLWEYLIKPRWWLLAASGFSAGLALVSKFSALLLVPIVGLIVALSLLIAHQPFLLPLKTVQNGLRQNLLHAAGVLSLSLFFALLTIPPAYLFQGFEPWLSGFSRFKSLADAGRLAFFFGEYSYEGWWSYYLVCFLIKTPIGSLMLIAASLLCYRVGSPLQWREVIFLLLPVAVIFLAMTQSKVNIGLRHILPAYPFLFVLASRVATVHFRRHCIAPLLIGTPLVLTAISSLRIAPHQLAYFNEFVGGPDQGYRYLSDSNVDWGQDLKGVKTYTEKKNLPIIYLSYFGTAPPSYYGIRHQYVPGAWPLNWPPPADKMPASASAKFSRLVYLTCKTFPLHMTHSFAGSGCANRWRRSATLFYLRPDRRPRWFSKAGRNVHLKRELDYCLDRYWIRIAALVQPLPARQKNSRGGSGWIAP
jgi:hypothetical protein